MIMNMMMTLHCSLLKELNKLVKSQKVCGNILYKKGLIPVKTGTSGICGLPQGY